MFPLLSAFYFCQISFCSHVRIHVFVCSSWGHRGLLWPVAGGWADSLGGQPSFLRMRWQFTPAKSVLPESCSYHSFLCWEENLAKIANSHLRFGPVKAHLALSDTKGGGSSETLQGSRERPKQFVWEPHQTCTSRGRDKSHCPLP